MEASKILTKAILADGRLSADDVKHIVAAKKEVIEREGLLEYYPTDQGLGSVADLASLKAWLAKRKGVVQEPGRAASFGLEFPKGMLLLGVPGCGKSLSAKAVASEWGLPRSSSTRPNLYNKYVGESERTSTRDECGRAHVARRALDRRARKAFGGRRLGDGGVSQRILGSFLSCMRPPRRRLHRRHRERRQRLPPDSCAMDASTRFFS